MEDGGQEPPDGEGEGGAAAGAGGGQPGPVAAAFVQAGFALLVMEGHQRGDQGIPLLGWQAGQRWVVQLGQVGAGPVKRIGGIAELVVCLGAEGVVPVAVPGVAGQGSLASGLANDATWHRSSDRRRCPLPRQVAH